MPERNQILQGILSRESDRKHILTWAEEKKKIRSSGGKKKSTHHNWLGINNKKGRYQLFRRFKRKGTVQSPLLTKKLSTLMITTELTENTFIQMLRSFTYCHHTVIHHTLHLLSFSAPSGLPLILNPLPARHPPVKIERAGWRACCCWGCSAYNGCVAIQKVSQ